MQKAINTLRKYAPQIIAFIFKQLNKIIAQKALTKEKKIVHSKSGSYNSELVSYPLTVSKTTVNCIFKRPKRKVTKVFLHCSANSNPKWGVKELEILHNQNTDGNGIQYHFFINRAGKVHNTRDLESHPIMAQEMNNTNSITICLHGGLNNKNDFTKIQLKQCKKLCIAINNAYNGIRFRGHCEVSKKGKLCPVFDYKAILQLDEQGKTKL